MFTISEIEHYASMESFIGSYVTYTKHVAAPLLPGYSLVIYTSGGAQQCAVTLMMQAII